MRIDVLTIFPEIFEGPLKASLLGKALDNAQALVQSLLDECKPWYDRLLEHAIRANDIGENS